MLGGAGLAVEAIRPIAEAARIPGREIPLGFAFGQPLGDCFADRRGMGDADLHAGGVIEVSHPRLRGQREARRRGRRGWGR